MLYTVSESPCVDEPQLARALLPVAAGGFRFDIPRALLSSVVRIGRGDYTLPP